MTTAGPARRPHLLEEPLPAGLSLAADHDVVGAPTSWRVVHDASGRHVLARAFTADEAVKAAHALGAVADWTAEAEVLRADDAARAAMVAEQTKLDRGEYRKGRRRQQATPSS